VQRLKFDIVLPQQRLVPAKAVQQLALGETLAPLAGLRRWDASCVRLVAVCAGESAVAADFPLLTEDAGEHAWSFGVASL
jgi:hypothetical protein